MNFSNLINNDLIKHDSQTYQQDITIGTLNVRSLKLKSESIIREFGHCNLDILILTETWLNNTDNEKAWIDQSGLNSKSLQFHHIHRKDGWEGGIALLCKPTYNVKLYKDLTTRSFEGAYWSIKSGQR